MARRVSVPDMAGRRVELELLDASLRKLGLSSRIQAAALAHRGELH